MVRRKSGDLQFLRFHRLMLRLDADAITELITFPSSCISRPQVAVLAYCSYFEGMKGGL
jgi:hypothetical protein